MTLLLTLFSDRTMKLTATTRCICVLVLATTGACRTESSENGMAVRDSAGVMFVEHGAELRLGTEHWSFEPTPVLDVGKAEVCEF